MYIIENIPGDFPEQEAIEGFGEVAEVRGSVGATEDYPFQQKR